MDNNTTQNTAAEEEFVDDIGLVAFEGALVEYLADKDEAEQEAFARYVEEHSAEDGFLDTLCDQYPAFEKLLIAEMRSITDEFSALTADERSGNSQLSE